MTWGAGAWLFFVSMMLTAGWIVAGWYIKREYTALIHDYRSQLRSSWRRNTLNQEQIKQHKYEMALLRSANESAYDRGWQAAMNQENTPDAS